MKELNYLEIVDVLVKAAYYQAEVYKLYRLDIVEVAKHKDFIAITLYYDPREVTFGQFDLLFRDYFKDFKKFINKDCCYSNSLSDNRCAAHFEINFYA